MTVGKDTKPSATSITTSFVNRGRSNLFSVRLTSLVVNQRLVLGITLVDEIGKAQGALFIMMRHSLWLISKARDDDKEGIEQDLVMVALGCRSIAASSGAFLGSSLITRSV